MLEHLFGSKARVKLLQLFLNNPDQPHYLRELTRALKMQLNSIRREVANLERLGIIKSVEAESVEVKKTNGSKKYFLANKDFLLFPELKGLLLKAELMLERDFVAKIEKMAKVKLFILSGLFVGVEDSSTDILIVGAANRTALAKLVRDFEKQLGQEINYTVMSLQEFKYRKDITDRFLYNILENKKIVVVNTL